MKRVRVALLAVCIVSLSACSGGGSNSRIDYKEAKTLPALDVPPDLSEPRDTGVDNVPQLGIGATRAEDGSTIRSNEQQMRIAHDGSTRWLVIDATPAELWPRLRQFWASLGLEIKKDEPSLGVMETQWAENRADTPQGFFPSMVKKIFPNAYSAGLQDKYRIRLEPAADGHTELFLTHYGLKEVVPESQTGELTKSYWEVRPSDPELANEVLNRLVLFLGGSKETAKQVLKAQPEQTPSRAHIDGDMLVLDEGFSRAWRLTGLALDRIGLVVDDRNRSEGIYYVSGIDQLADAGVEQEEGFFASLFSSDSEGGKKVEKLQVLVTGGDSSSRIRLRDTQGEPLTSKQNLSILKRLQESLR
jgi:outer membrane protein assembly factor BamC